MKGILYSAKFYYFELEISQKRYTFMFVLNLSDNTLSLTNISRIGSTESILSDEYDSLVDKIYLDIISPAHTQKDVIIEIKYLEKSLDEDEND